MAKTLRSRLKLLLPILISVFLLHLALLYLSPQKISLFTKQIHYLAYFESEKYQFFFDKPSRNDLLGFGNENEKLFRNYCYMAFDERLSKSFSEKQWNYFTSGIRDHRYQIKASDLSSCSEYLHNRISPLIRTSVTPFEKDFPLAFNLLVYHNFEQVEELFRTIYRPNNFYCFHIDQLADEQFKQKVSLIEAH